MGQALLWVWWKVKLRSGVLVVSVKLSHGAMVSFVGFFIYHMSLLFLVIRPVCPLQQYPAFSAVNLLQHMTPAESLTTFHRLLKTHLFRKSFPDYLLDIS